MLPLLVEPLRTEGDRTDGDALEGFVGCAMRAARPISEEEGRAGCWAGLLVVSFADVGSMRLESIEASWVRASSVSSSEGCVAATRGGGRSGASPHFLRLGEVSHLLR